MNVLFYVIGFLIVLLVINSILAPGVVKEMFAANDSLPIKVLNICGRELIFPYYGTNNKFTAGQRAKVDDSLTTVPPGKCALANLGDLTNSINESFSILTENSVFYTLKKSCMALNLVNYRLENNGDTIICSFALDTPQNFENVARFLLVNPLFVEFSFGDKSSYGYIVTPTRPDSTQGNSLYFSNSPDTPFVNYHSHSGKKFIFIRFDRAVALDDGNCDKPFNYKVLSPSQVKATAENLDSAIIGNNGGLLNMWVYYLDDLSTNFQKTGKDLPIKSVNTQDIVIFDKNFKNMSKDPYKVSEYEFMNNIASMYYNYVIPIFNFTFDMSLTTDMYDRVKNNKYTLMRCYMDNDYMNGPEQCRNNIFAIDLDPNPFETPSVFILSIIVGDRDGCGYTTQRSPVLNLQLPYLTPGNKIKVTVTLGPNQKYAYAQWTDINSGDLGKKISYAKIISCFNNPPFNVCGYEANINNALRDINDFTKIFSSKTLSPRPNLENIHLVFNESGYKFVNNITSFGIGYKNLNNNFAEK